MTFTIEDIFRIAAKQGKPLAMIRRASGEAVLVSFDKNASEYLEKCYQEYLLTLDRTPQNSSK